MIGSIPTFYRFCIDKIDMSALRHSVEICLLYFLLIISFSFFCMCLCVNALGIDFLYLNVFITGVLHFTVKFVLILFFMVITIYQVTAMLFLSSNDRR